MTPLPFAETLDRIKSRFPERRACRPDRELVVGQHTTFIKRQLISRIYPFSDHEPANSLRLEQEVAGRIKRSVKAEE